MPISSAVHHPQSCSFLRVERSVHSYSVVLQAVKANHTPALFQSHRVGIKKESHDQLFIKNDLVAAFSQGFLDWSAKV